MFYGIALVAAATLTGLLFAALTGLHRVGEWDHHGYYGIALCALSLVWSPSAHWLIVPGLILLADDTYQHVTQDVERLQGHAVRPDFTVIHKIGAWIVAFSRRPGWLFPACVVALMAIAAIVFSVLGIGL